MSHLQYVMLAYTLTAITLVGLTTWLVASKIYLQKKLLFLKNKQTTLRKRHEKTDTK